MPAGFRVLNLLHAAMPRVNSIFTFCKVVGLNTPSLYFKVIVSTGLFVLIKEEECLFNDQKILLEYILGLGAAYFPSWFDTIQA